MYFGYNALATAFSYRLIHNKACELLKEGGHGTIEVALSCSSGSSSAELSSSDGATSRVRVLPHVYLSDALSGRQQWVVTCRKGAGRTEWFTGPPAAPPAAGPPGAGGQWPNGQDDGWPPPSGGGGPPVSET